MAELTVGSEIAGLRIGPVAGRGGSSTVYRAVDLRTGEPRAAKVLTTADGAADRRLQREADLLSKVDHPSVVPFRGLYRDDHRSILVTNWVEGQSLHERLQQRQSLSVDEAVRILADLADPLDHLHRLGIVHRDISPANVIVAPDGQVTLIDLGIGHLVSASTLTNDDLLAGTPKYLAPEVIRGATADARADQYSVAVMIHELITGHSPFPMGEQIATALHHQLSSAPTALDEIDPTIPTPLSNAVLRALAKEPDDRFSSMADFVRAATAPVPAAGTDLAAGSDSTAGRSRSASLLVGGLGVLALFAVGALIGVLATGGDDPIDTSAAADSQAGDATSEQQDAEPGAVLSVAVPADEAGATEPTDSTDSTQPTDQTDQTGSTESGQLAELALPIADPAWFEGRAGQLACNLLTGHTFENGSVPVDYYGNPPGRERVIDRDGFDGSWALEVGLAGAYGQYGEIIDIEPGRSYVFRGWFEVREPVADAEFGVLFLDEGYDPVEGTGTSRTLSNEQTDTSEPGFRELTFDSPPPGAFRAVPYLFKDSSEGVLLADEMVFGPSDACMAEFEPGQ